MVFMRFKGGLWVWRFFVPFGAGLWEEQVWMGCIGVTQGGIAKDTNIEQAHKVIDSVD